MAEGKKTFVAYANWIATFEKLTDEEAGRLIKHLFRYVNDLNPEPPDRMTELVFEQFKQILKVDLGKWKAIRERNKINGAKGGRPKKDKEPKKPTGLIGNPKEPRKADNDNVNDNVNDIKEKTNKKEVEFKESIKPYVEKYGKDICDNFYLYWTEPNKSKTKLRYELEKTWDVSRRLANWASRDKTFNTKNSEKDKSNVYPY